MQVFADDETSQNPLTVPRAWIWNLRRRNLLRRFSASTIFSGKRIIAPSDVYKLNQFYLSSKFWLTIHFFCKTGLSTMEIQNYFRKGV